MEQSKVIDSTTKSHNKLTINSITVAIKTTDLELTFPFVLTS